MKPPDPSNPILRPPEQAFAQRFTSWEILHHQQGPGRSYPYAWRLPELARPLGRTHRIQAHFALALDLYTLGRFEEALAALPEADDWEETTVLRRRLHLLLGHREPGEDEVGIPLGEQAYLAYLQDLPEAWKAPDLSDMGEVDRPWLTVLRIWSLARQGQPVSLTASHLALARLRGLAPTLAAQAEAVHAEAAYWLGPRWAPVWLDHALDQVELFSQHHLKPRLLGLKARALEASGKLREGARFRKLAQTLAKRQGALLHQRLFIDSP